MKKRKKFRKITVEEAIVLWDCKVDIWYAPGRGHKPMWMCCHYSPTDFCVWSTWAQRMAESGEEVRLKVEIE
jgi:hypothetical protein